MESERNEKKKNVEREKEGREEDKTSKNVPNFSKELSCSAYETLQTGTEI